MAISYHWRSPLGGCLAKIENALIGLCNLRRKFNQENLVRCAALATIFCIPISKAGTNIFAAIFVVLAISSSYFWHALPAMRNTPLVYCALGLFMLPIIGLSWSPLPLGEVADNLSVIFRYKKLLLIPLLLPFFKEKKYKKIALWIFFTSLLCILTLSYSNYFGFTKIGSAYSDDGVKNAWVFRHHITQSLCITVLALISFFLSFTVTKNIFRYSLYAIVGLAFINVFVLLQSRTGQILFAIASIAVIFYTLNAKEKQNIINNKAFSIKNDIEKKIEAKWLVNHKKFIILLLVIVSILFLLSQSKDIQKINHEISDHLEYNIATSSGTRLEFYVNSLFLIKQKPIFGYGTIDISYLLSGLAYDFVISSGIGMSDPHSEFFVIAIQFGLIGVAIFIAFFVFACSNGRTLPYRYDAQLPIYQYIHSIFCLIFILGCIFNSFLSGPSEGFICSFMLGIFGNLDNKENLSV